MAQHDYVIANQGFPAFRSDLNDALAAIVSNNSGATEPTTMFAHQIWVDTAANPSILKIRNADNDAWITIGAIDQTGDTFTMVNLKASGPVVFNDAGADVDFRVESDTVQNALFVDGATGCVGVGTTPDAWAAGSAIDVSGWASFAQRNDNGYTLVGGNLYFDGTDFRYKNSSSAALYEVRGPAGTHVWSNASSGTADNVITFTPRMTLDSSGNLLVGTTSSTPDLHKIEKNVVEDAGNGNLGIYSASGFNVFFFGITGTGNSVANTGMMIKKDTGTNRSINAAGTINASGADYAEYMIKAGEFELAKSDICGVNSDGKLTNVFADAVAFVVKSTNPSYVGGDTWGNEDAVGKKPVKPIQQAAEVDEEGNETQPAETDEDFAARQAQYENDLAEFEAKLEAERQKVDRIAFSGQVPVNVIGATAGQYIVPVESNGGITGVAVNEADMTLGQYMKAVGKVIAIEEDGRARIIVKVA